MIVRRIAAILVVPLMLAFGTGVYMYLGTLKSKVVKEKAQLPTVTKPKFVLPGTMFVVQDGRIFKLNNGNFTEIGPGGDWSQPTVTPDHTHLIAVSRGGQSSDLYLLDLDGNVIKRMTRNDSRIIDGNHWAFYPRVTPDGASVLYSYDSPKYGYQVDFAIWSMPINGTQAQARRRTTPNDHTGGDVTPVPTSGTSVLYVSHSIDPSTAVHSEILLQKRAFGISTPLTNPADDCSQPALSPDGTQLAMICTGGKQTARLEVAPFNGVSLGPARILLDGGLYAQPTWSPDGQALVYYAPGDAAGHFELWYLPMPTVTAATATPAAPPTATPKTTATATARATVTATPTPTPSPTPIAPMRVTQGVDLSATSAPAWF
jgi:Tol biopolymer transport system component